MKSFIHILRKPYEEPHLLNLVMTASNGAVQGSLEFYLNADALLEWAEGMERFPLHARSLLRWEIGSEYPDDRFAFYFRMRLITVDSVGHSAIHLRFNNNADVPEREVSEFCIRAEPGQVNRLGRLMREFAQLQHWVLWWSLTEGAVFVTVQDAEQVLGGDA